MPQSMTMAGSSMMSGTGPSAGGVSCLRPLLDGGAALRDVLPASATGPRGAEPVDHEVIRSMIADSSSKCVSWKTSSASAKNPCVGQQPPNSRILLKNRFVYQCSQ